MLHLCANPGWDDELKDANKDKMGRPSSTPNRASSSSRSYI